jgi:acetyl-CoA carboxylase biotin carboxyl carrier protein
MFSFEQLKELIELIAKHGLQGIEVERSGYRITITGKEAAGSPPAPVVAAPAPAAPPAAAVMPAAATAPAAGQGAGAAETEGSGVPEGAHVVTSPIVGTFYRAPAPDADSFVEVGDRVRKGQVLCIVEAMKLMNEIESDAEGEVVKVFPENAQAVEYGEPLFAIAKA